MVGLSGYRNGWGELRTHRSNGHHKNIAQGMPNKKGGQKKKAKGKIERHE